MDPYANYFCQKLLNFANEKHIDRILDWIEDKFVEICNDTHGTRACQNLVEWMSLNLDRIRFIQKTLQYDVVTLSTNQHGNHILNICLNRFPSSEIDFIVDSFSENCREVASNKHGWMVIQKCLMKCSEVQRQKLAGRIVGESLSLAQNEFGNYIIQSIIKMNDVNHNHKILQAFTPHLSILCVQKFSSNVIEKVSYIANYIIVYWDLWWYNKKYALWTTWKA